jgi:DNA-binding NtrC family response regulator
MQPTSDAGRAVPRHRSAPRFQDAVDPAQPIPPRPSEGPVRSRSIDPGGGASDGMLGRSPALERLRSELARAAPTGLPILLLGESGTGKELAAESIHASSGRRGKLVPVNCGALSPDVVESTLFGHERGAFTGADARKTGLFEEAAGGTLFLDEIGELPRDLQPKLLRALETGRIRPVGAAGERAVHVRIVAATHRDLAAAVDDGAFRLDLYHRLSAIELRVPPLRERAEDIPLLARHFLDATGVGGPGRSFTPEGVAAMARHPWPGNVRELRNAVTRAAHLGGAAIAPEDLFPRRHRAPGSPPPSRTPMRLEELQRRAIVDALRDSGGNLRGAARTLGVAHSTLHDRVRRWGLR